MLNKHGFTFKPSAPDKVLDAKFQDFHKSYKGSFVDRHGNKQTCGPHRAFDVMYLQGLLDGNTGADNKGAGKKDREGPLFSGKRSNKAEPKIHADKLGEVKEQSEGSEDSAS